MVGQSPLNATSALGRKQTLLPPHNRSSYSDPDIVQSSPLTTFVTGIQNVPWFDHQQLRFSLSRCSVLYTTWYDIQFTRANMNTTLWQIDTQDTFEHEKRLIGFWV